MTKAEADEKYIAIIDEWLKERETIIEKAVKDGIYIDGLDTNRELFKELTEKYKKKIGELWLQIDEKERRELENAKK